MFKRLNALLWSRKEVLFANKSTAAVLFMPALMTALYAFIFKDMPKGNEMIFKVIPPMLGGMIGYVLPTVISEEAEKHNQRSLFLAGVKLWEYLVSSLFAPFICVLIYLIVLPLVLQITLNNWFIYLLVNLVTAVTLFMLFMAVSLSFDTQAKASLAAMPIMMIGILLPLLSMTSPELGKIVEFSPMAAFAKWSASPHYSLLDKSFWITLIWLVAGITLCIFLANRQKHKK